MLTGPDEVHVIGTGPTADGKRRTPKLELRGAHGAQSPPKQRKEWKELKKRIEKEEKKKSYIRVKRFPMISNDFQWFQREIGRDLERTLKWKRFCRSLLATLRLSPRPLASKPPPRSPWPCPRETPHEESSRHHLDTPLYIDISI